ncbi:MAG: hypothetical protein HY913_00595 [Desulfomonile tiedjei]|nr:hypothetical protein [Desulfomonile tiedjei]
MAKDHPDVHILPSGTSARFDTDSRGLDALVEAVKEIFPKSIVLEATGGYERVVAASLTTEGMPPAVVNPRQIRDSCMRRLLGMINAMMKSKEPPMSFSA